MSDPRNGSTDWICVVKKEMKRLVALAVCLTGYGLQAQEMPARVNHPPRKVLLGTVVSGYDVSTYSLERRLQWMDDTVDHIAAEGTREYPGKRMDLVVLPEYLLERPADSADKEAVRMAEVEPRLAACARRRDCYLVVPMVLREEGPGNVISNAAVLVDRSGRVAGIYRKVHPVAPQGSDVLEAGTAPGRDFPVFDCDFGRLGIQICWDMLYPDGWQSLAAQGAEIVALPTASPETAHPLMYALQHGYYIVSAAPRDQAAVYSPLGVIEAGATQEGVLVHQIDLSYAILHWDALLEEGVALKRRFGDRVDYRYYRPQDAGIFWSNDPSKTIGSMIQGIGLMDRGPDVERIRVLEDKARGGQPGSP
jgi:predicted amidohydrolase